ncbi:unnamed protein product, partial [Arabidopsis halleri]
WRETLELELAQNTEEEEEEEEVQILSRTPNVEGKNHREQEFLGEFGDLSVILKEWRDIAHIIGPVLKQRAAICWAIVFARLLEAAHNIALDEETKSFIEISINDLVKKIKKDTKDMEIGSLKKCFKIIRESGLAKKSPTSVQNDELAQKITWVFASEEKANMTFIVTKLNRSPVGIIIEIDEEFGELREGIYKVRRVQPDSNGDILRHALLITGHGHTPNGRHFLITQNSWDTDWGVKGYGRIAIEGDMTCLVFYPTF